VPEHDRAGLLPGPLLHLVGQQLADPPSRTCPKASCSPVAVAIVPSLGVAPSATTMIGE
jgi:hypothetical protein